MAKLSGLSQYFDPGLTLGGVPGRDGVEREYVIPLPSAELGLWCQQAATAAGRIQAASTEAEVREAVERVNALPELDSALSLGQKVLGTAYAQMMGDGVAHPYIQVCAGTAYVWIVAGEDQAEQYWRSGGRPNPPGPANREQRRAAAKSGGTSGGAAGKTRTPASGSGTRSPRKSAQPKASKSPGKRSSAAGS